MLSSPSCRAAMSSVTALRRSRVAAATGVALLFATAGMAAAQSVAGDPVVARVDKVEIHQGDLAVAAENLQTIPGKDEQAKAEYLVTYLSDMILLAKAAEEQKLADDADLARRIAFTRKKALMDRMLAHAAEEAANEKNVRSAYDEIVKNFSKEMEVHARHILFRPSGSDEAADAAAKARAEAAAARIRKGEDFATVAKELTDEASGKSNGGDLGYFIKSQMMPEFAEVAFSLDNGQVSDPVKTKFGWHVILVMDKRVRQAPAFDTIKPQLEIYVKRKAQIDLVSKLRATASIEHVSTPAPIDAGK